MRLGLSLFLLVAVASAADEVTAHRFVVLTGQYVDLDSATVMSRATIGDLTAEFRLTRTGHRFVLEPVGDTMCIVGDGVDDPTLYEVIEEELLAGYQQNTNVRKQVDAIAWLCKALGRSGDPKYKDTLKKVMETARSRHVAKYARISYTALD